MNRILRSSVILAVFSALVLLGAACASDSPSVAGEDSAPATSQAPSDEPVDEPSEAPSVDIGSAELPEGFPGSFPIPERAEPAGSASAGGTYIVWFTSGDVNADDLDSYFSDELPSNGWTIDSEVDVDQGEVAYHAFAISGNGYMGGIYIGEGAPGSEQFEGEFAFWVQLTPSG